MIILNKEEIEKISKIEGKILGSALKNKFKFVLEEKGEEGVLQVEKELEKLGYPIKLKEIKTFDFYPTKIDIFLLNIIKNIFNLSDEKIVEIGKHSAKISLIVKIMMKYFSSIERVAEEVGNYWKKHHTQGNLRKEKVDLQKKEIILVLENFIGHPLYCRYLEGFFWQIASYVILDIKNLKVKEIECVFNGSNFHKFKITW
jgi:predicted hydrocarbon binding protein